MHVFLTMAAHSLRFSTMSDTKALHLSLGYLVTYCQHYESSCDLPD